jgi:hypothetical protein
MTVVVCAKATLLNEQIAAAVMIASVLNIFPPV